MGWLLLSLGLRWQLGDGRLIHFWTDIWVGEEALTAVCQGSLHVAILEGRACDYWNDVEGW